MSGEVLAGGGGAHLTLHYHPHHHTYLPLHLSPYPPPPTYWSPHACGRMEEPHTTAPSPPPSPPPACLQVAPTTGPARRVHGCVWAELPSLPTYYPHLPTTTSPLSPLHTRFPHCPCLPFCPTLTHTASLPPLRSIFTSPLCLLLPRQRHRRAATGTVPLACAAHCVSRATA